MRVLTITEALLEIILEEELFIQACCLAHVCSDHHVILCSMGICLSRKLETGFLSGVAVLTDFADDLGIILRIADYSHCAPVLCCATEHRRASYVYVLDCILHCHIRLCDCLLERIEVHTHHIDELDAVLFELRDVAVKIATSEKSAMNLRVKGLHATVTDFRETCDLADIDNLKSCILQKLHCTTCCDDLPAEIHQLTGEFYYAGLITN